MSVVLQRRDAGHRPKEGASFHDARVPMSSDQIQSAPVARERLIDTAIALFNRYGFHATGVDRIVAAAKVAKKTLYAHFPSKEELILAALSRKRAAFADKFLPMIQASSSDPRERLLNLFELAKSWFQDPDFFGCIFINAAVEY